MADLYRSKVEELGRRAPAREHAPGSSEMLRGLIESTALAFKDGQLGIELKGNLAAMLTAAQKARRSPETGDLRVPIEVVAGACSQLNVEFAWAAA